VVANLKKRPDVPVHSVTVWEEPDVIVDKFGDAFDGRALPVIVACISIFFFFMLLFLLV
jgi:hypothetical protein